MELHGVSGAFEGRLKGNQWVPGDSRVSQGRCEGFQGHFMGSQRYQGTSGSFQCVSGASGKF